MSSHDSIDTAAGDECGVVAGIDIGGSTTSVVLCLPDLTVLDSVEVATPAHDGGAAVIREAVQAVREICDRSGRSPIGVGVGAAGVVDAVEGHVLVASESFRDWAGFPVASAVTQTLGVPAWVDNDVNAFLRGEAIAGAAAGERYVLGVALGTGVGGALWMDGALVEGAHGAACEIGHIPGFGDFKCSCGQYGHLETIASGWAIARRYSELTGRDYDAREVCDAARQRDEAARSILIDAGRGVARAAALVAGIVDVTSVVVGGGLAGAWDVLCPIVAEALELEPPVSGHVITARPSGLGRQAVAVGAAVRAWQECAQRRRGRAAQRV